MLSPGKVQADSYNGQKEEKQMKFKKALLVEPGRFEIREVEENPGRGQLLVKVASCGLCNWELNFWQGKLGAGTGKPLALGHEWAGTVVETGEGVTDFQVGDIVACGVPEMSDFGGFAEYAVAGAGSVLKLAPNINPKYALGEPLKCILTVLRGAKPEAGDYGVVLGAGPMGMWCIQALRGEMLSELIVIDIDDEKLKTARKYGATVTINSRSQNVEEELKKITHGHMADFVIEGTGVPALLDTAQDYLKFGKGRLILMSSHESVCEQFDFRKAVARSLEIIVTHPGHSDDPKDDFRRAMNLLTKGTFKNEEMVTHEFKLSEIMTAFHTLEHKPKDYLKGIVVPD